VTTDERKLYREALAKARESFSESSGKLEKVKQEGIHLEQEIANLRKTITALSAMCSEEPGIDKLGITDSVIEVMSDTPFSWTTGEVVIALDSMGFDLASQKNAQASVHAVLARMAQKEKLTRVPKAKTNANGNPWEWRGPRYNAEQDLQGGFCYAPGEQPLDDDDIPF
jgi:hypothetical protein